MRDLPRSVTEQFAIEGTFVDASPLGNGHIHRTFAARYEGPGGAVRRVVHQELNTRVFRDPTALMRNVERICEHLEAKAAGLRDAARRSLHLIPTRSGDTLHVDDAGGHWRTYALVERAVSHERVRSLAQAEATAAAFARFIGQLEDLPGPPLATTIPHFHDTPKRWVDLQQAIERDTAGRVGEVEHEIVLARALLARIEREQGARGTATLPRRTVHNDCKLNNLLCDEATDEPLCVIDLDTVMEGTLLFDFGELVRTAACDAPEDAPDTVAIEVDEAVLTALTRGFLEGASGFITPAERAALPVAGPLLAFENGIRFLADHLDGDPYFRVHRPGQNLDRARTQLRVADLLLEKVDIAAAALEAG